jgi:glycosyltransferase involved in cell wall biosynthesis
MDDWKYNSVSVVLASYNQVETLPLVLESFNKQYCLPVEVIVSDDGSTDGTIDYLDNIPDGVFNFDLLYVSGKHLGYNLVEVNNRGCRIAKGHRILFTNSDILHCASSVCSHGHLGREYIGGGFINGIALPMSQEVKVSDVKKFEIVEDMSRRFPPKMTNIDYFNGPAELNFYGVWGGNYSVPKWIWQSIGGFNSGYKMLYGGEEADFIQRARKLANAKVEWARDSVSYHLEHEPRTYRKLAKGNDKYRKEYL